MDKQLLVCLIAFLLLAQNVYSLGITPGRTTIDFTPDKSQDIQISVLNTEKEEVDVILMIQGELNQSVSINKNKIDFSSSIESSPIDCQLKLPSSLSPGVHQAEIVALKVPKSSATGTFVGATVAVVSQIHVYVPYPGKYVEADLNVMDAEEGSPLSFIVPVQSRGKLGIGNVRAVIDIYTSLNKKVGQIETDGAALEAGQRIELSAKFDDSLVSGDYLAKVSVFYDGETISLERQFSVGSEKLSIESIMVNNFQLGEIAKLQILVENKWNSELKGVFANLLVYNKQNQVMADIKSASDNVPALSKKELVAYWDTVGVEKGDYNGKLIVNYGQKSTDKNLVLKVKEDSLDVIGVGYAINPRARGKGGFDITTLLLVLVILLLLVNLAWFVFFRRIMGKSVKK